MQRECVTTPFGRRPMTLGMLTIQQASNEVEANRSVDKWKIFRALCEARPRLNVSDRALAVLNALLSFYPGNTLSREAGLVVFPSNAQLSIRAHGIAPATLRRHLAALVEAGLLVRKDSPNGKRYARHGRDGEISQAFGFSIAPLIAREKEFLCLAAQVAAEKERLRLAREQISLCRRDISKLIEIVHREGIEGDWTSLDNRFQDMISLLPRSATADQLLQTLDDLGQFRLLLINVLEKHSNLQNMNANESRNERHIKESYPESISESEAANENLEQTSDQASHSRSSGTENCLLKDSFEPDVSDPAGTSHNDLGNNIRRLHQAPSILLETVLRACPEIRSYAPKGSISRWRDLADAALIVRSMLGISQALFDEACSVMGHESAAIVIACILERSEHVASAGAYFRDLINRARRGAFSAIPMLMALLRVRAKDGSPLALH